jgi:hypothetical protein
MDSDREQYGGRVPLAGFGDSGPSDPAGRPDSLHVLERHAVGPGRNAGIRHARRMSNWTAAALIVGAAAATTALAHHAVTTAVPAAGAASAPKGTGTTAATAQGGPQAAHSVATTSASGVTITRTTQTVNGKTVVTQVRHAPAYTDN